MVVIIIIEGIYNAYATPAGVNHVNQHRISGANNFVIMVAGNRPACGACVVVYKGPCFAGQRCIVKGINNSGSATGAVGTLAPVGPARYMPERFGVRAMYSLAFGIKSIVLAIVQVKAVHLV